VRFINAKEYGWRLEVGPLALWYSPKYDSGALYKGKHHKYCKWIIKWFQPFKPTSVLSLTIGDTVNGNGKYIEFWGTRLHPEVDE
jgi:hypothetical protein